MRAASFRGARRALGSSASVSTSRGQTFACAVWPRACVRGQSIKPAASVPVRQAVFANSYRASGHRKHLQTEAVGNASDGTATASASTTASVPAPTDLLELYCGLVAEGKLTWDDEQVRCIMHLRRLLDTLENYQPPVDLLARLSPSAPYIARQTLKSESESGSRVSSWWKGKSRALMGDSMGDDEKRLVRVLSGEEELENLTTPKGILLTGPPGTGKSLLLSLFFRLLPIPKKRVHYHAFTLSLYKQVFEEMEKRRHAPEEEGWKKVENMELAGKKGWRAVFAGGRWDEEGKEVKWEREEGIPFIIARNMILEYHVLYFDELQLLDASSAALLRDVLSWYWRLGGVIVACSNRVPEDLYHHGVQKDRMLGFLDALKSRCEVVSVDGGRDWRTMGQGGDVRWYNQHEREEFESAWQDKTAGTQVGPVPISVYGRTVVVPKAVGRTCRISFSDLCEQPLGPADYLTLASTFSTFFIDDLPTLLLKHKNEARRLINLIDALYESRCQIYIQSSATPSTLFFPDAIQANDNEHPSSATSGSADEMTNERIMAAEALSETLAEPYRPNISLYNTQTPSQRARQTTIEAREAKGSAFSVLGIWTGEDERFAYKRAVSRLVEMTTSSTYAKEDWLPLEQSTRTWEGLPRAGSSTVSGKLAKGGWTLSNPVIREVQDASDDLAVEAGYSRPHRLTPTTSTSSQSERKQVGSATHFNENVILSSNEDNVRRQGKTLYNPPVIKEQHVWGVEDDWGPKAGRWGKGVKAFDTSKSEVENEASGSGEKSERG